MKKTIFIILCTILTMITITTVSAQEPPPFSDIKKDSWYEESALYCYKYGYIDGTAQGIFSPETKLTRAMAVKIFHSMSGDTQEYTYSPFTDINDGSWYYKSVLWAYNTSLTNGTGNKSFSPNKNITRGEFVTMSFNYYCSVFHDNNAKPSNVCITDFTDCEKIADYAVEAFDWAISYKIISGFTDSTLRPNELITRAQAVKIIHYFDTIFSHKFITLKYQERSCSVNGRAVYQCTLCNTERSVFRKAYHLWNSGRQTIAPLCTSDGETVFKCTVCNAEKKETIAKRGYHNYGDWTITKAATKSSTGIESRLCDRCDNKLSRIYRHSSYYGVQDKVILPSGGYEVSKENIGLKVIYTNLRLLGTTNASYTAETARAVRNFQKNNGLRATGTVDLATWLMMGYSEESWYCLAAYITPKKTGEYNTREECIEAMLSVAKEYADMGTEYRIGSSGKPGTYADCSGLIYQCLYAVGINPDTNIIDHGLAVYEYTSYYLAKDPKLGLSVPLGEIQRGDLIFYANNGSSRVCHVGIYAGNGMIYDAWPNIGTTYRSVNIRGCHTVKAVRIFP